MTDLAALARGLAGAWRLLRLDPTGLFHFDASAEGARRSFQAMLFALPVQAILVALSATATDRALGAREIAIEALLFVIDWTAPLVGVSFLAARMGWSGRLTTYISAYNYSYLLSHWLFLAGIVLAAFLGGGQVVMFIVTIGLITYQAMVARMALKLAAMEAALFGLILFFLYYGIETLRGALIAAGS